MKMEEVLAKRGAFPGLETPSGRWLIKVMSSPRCSGLSAGLQTNVLLIRFLVRARAWVEDQPPVGDVREAPNQRDVFLVSMVLSFFFSLLSPFS